MQTLVAAIGTEAGGCMGWRCRCGVLVSFAKRSQISKLSKERKWQQPPSAM